ncbi:MAG: hypothetical protein U0230_20735 [Polyangiales bacterium]
MAVNAIHALKFVRDHGPCSTADVAQALRPPGLDGTMASLFYTETNSVLRSLADAGVVEITDVERNIWAVTSLLAPLQGALGLSLTHMRLGSGMHPEVVELVYGRTTRLTMLGESTPAIRDVIASMNEVAACLSIGCYGAAIAMSGRVIEICLRYRLERLGVSTADDWSLGTLLGRLKEVGTDDLPPSIHNVANLIKEERNTAIHARTRREPPTADRALLVVHAVMDSMTTLLRAE